MATSIGLNANQANTGAKSELGLSFRPHFQCDFPCISAQCCFSCSVVSCHSDRGRHIRMVPTRESVLVSWRQITGSGFGTVLFGGALATLATLGGRLQFIKPFWVARTVLPSEFLTG